MSTPERTLAPASASEANVTRAATKPQPQIAEDDVGPSRVMEVGLHALVTGLLIVSIIGIAYVYGFNLQTGSLLDNISAAVRALGVDGGFFLGLYFSRRLWMRRKRGWGDGIKTSLFGMIWFLVALLMASLSWFSNTLFVTNYQTIITQDLLDRAGFNDIPPELVNKAIGAIPLVIVLLYSIVPRRMAMQTDLRTTEEIEEEALREAARIRAQNMVAAARAEGAGQRIRTVLGGLAKEAFNLEERQQRDERLKQMRIAMETAGYPSGDLSDEQLEIQAVSRGVWDQTNDRPVKAATPPVQVTEERPASVTHPPRLAKREVLPIDALDHEELEVWQPLERSWDDEEPLLDQSFEGAVTFGELAEALHVANGTITYWTRPDFTGPYKIFAHEVITAPDGVKYVRPEVLLRLLRIRTKSALPKANGFATSAQGALPAGSSTWKSNGHHS